jgi:hypothetical protein
MASKPKCKKCGRLLKSPTSIARGIGPKCAGVSDGRRSVKAQTGRWDGTIYSLGISSSIQTTLPNGNTESKRLSKRELVKRNKEERRRLFDERLPFQCGLLLPERKPIIYTPTEDGGWKDSTSGHIISHERLQSYLKQYRFI